MAILGKENLEAEAARRAKFRLNHVGTKLNEAELRAFESLVEKRRQTQGEFIRDLIAAEVRRDQEGETPSPEMVEIVAVRLLLMNMFKSLLVTGDLMPAEKWEWYLTEITKRSAVSRQICWRATGKRSARSPKHPWPRTLRSGVRQGSPLRFDRWRGSLRSALTDASAAGVPSHEEHVCSSVLKRTGVPRPRLYAAAARPDKER